MLPAQAVEMQKAGMGASKIADALGVPLGQVLGWWRMLRYDPVEYHADTIAQMVQGGGTVLTAMQAIGVAAGSARKRINAMLESRGIAVPHTRVSVFGPGHCIRCGILLEPFNPGDAEQAGWQNGTRDGVHCTKCEKQMRTVAQEGQL